MTTLAIDQPPCGACGLRSVCLFYALAPTGITTHYQAGAEIVRKFTPNTGVHVVCKGVVAVSESETAQRDSILNVVSAGGMLGVVECCLDLRRYHFSARALTDAMITFFPQSDVQTVCRDHAGAMKILAEICGAFRQLERRYVLRDAAEASDRLIATLLWLSLMDEHASSKSATIPFEMTNSMLSSLIGTRPETVARLMSQFQTAQLIDYVDRRVVVTDRAGLKSRSSSDLSHMHIDTVVS